MLLYHEDITERSAVRLSFLNGIFFIQAIYDNSFELDPEAKLCDLVEEEIMDHEEIVCVYAEDLPIGGLLRYNTKKDTCEALPIEMSNIIYKINKAKAALKMLVLVKEHFDNE